MTNARPSKLDRLLTKQRQLAQEIAAINAREKAGERKADTRRKILIGGAVLASHQHGDFTEKQLVALLDGFLTLPRDRALFPFLPPRVDNTEKSGASTPTVPIADSSPTPASPGSATSPKPLPMDQAYRHDPVPRREDLL